MAQPLKNLVGREVQRRRNEAKLSQEKFAGACQRAGWDLSRGTLSKIEAGLRRVNDGEVFLLCAVLKCDVADLFRGVKRDKALSIARHGEA